MTLEEKHARAAAILHAARPVLIAYSGGVDSTCLLALAHRELGDEALGVIADSPSLPRATLADALRVADQIGAPVDILPTTEFENDDYLRNPLDRCYFCRVELFSRMEALARRRGFSHIAYGENADDPASLRPGSRAAAAFAVIAPLKQAGLTKADVRALSRLWGLPTHDAPAQPCLSTRIPHGTRVTVEALALVEKGEIALRLLGFRIFRVRYIDESPPGALVQIAPEETPTPALAKTLTVALQASGFSQVQIDPDGYRFPRQ